MKTFIQVAEIWTPSEDGSLLEFHSGLYGPHKAFGGITRMMCFGFDEGLPGKAWAERHPIVLKDLQHSYFRRGEAAAKAGLTCGVAIPLFDGETLKAVLVFFCGDDAEHVGAIEVWHNDPTQDIELGLADGYYGRAESFEVVSKRTRFQKGFGLPGLVWESGLPVVMADLGMSQRFLRRDEAQRIGINKGLGFPVGSVPGHQYIMAFLSALGTPIARRFEVWTATAEGDALTFQSGDCDSVPDFATALAGARIASGAGPIGQAMATKTPVLSASLADAEGPLAAAAQAGLGALVAIPVIDGGQTRAVACLYF